MIQNNVKEIIIEWLKEHGFDGLYNDAYECACLVDDDFMPCESDRIPYCEPGYKNECGDECNVDGCSGEFSFHICDYPPERKPGAQCVIKADVPYSKYNLQKATVIEADKNNKGFYYVQCGDRRLHYNERNLIFNFIKGR